MGYHIQVAITTAIQHTPYGGEQGNIMSEEKCTALAVIPKGETALAVIPKDAPKSRKKRRHRFLALKIAAVAASLVFASAGTGYAWLVNDDNERLQHVPENTVLDGEVDLSGMTRDEATAAVKQHEKDGFTYTVKVKADGETFTVKMDKVGKLDVEETVNQAFEPYGASSQVERLVERVKGMFTEVTSSQHDVTSVYDVAKKKLRKAIGKIASHIDTPAVDAGYEYDSSQGMLVGYEAHDGIMLDEKATYKKVLKALKDSTGSIKVKGVTYVVEPDNEYLGQAIFVDTYGCELYFYENGELIYNWPCSPGMPGHSTPQGDWYLEYKDYNPTWSNPGSSWATSMPDEIGPGASNPLGLRALAVSCGYGIYIHGTTNYGELGSQASHGCIRLANENIVTLCDAAETGIPIIIR